MAVGDNRRFSHAQMTSAIASLGMARKTLAAPSRAYGPALQGNGE
jgi:hypothetical protein